MAILAGELVPPATILEVAEQADVALGALSRRERLRFTGVLLRGRRYRNRCDLFSLRRCVGDNSERHGDHQACQDPLAGDKFWFSHNPSL